jgi:CubicO group peptidase (beta-lactamase class C family)
LGYIIEKVTGKPYEQVVRERILTPVGMTHSGFDFVHLGDTGKATGYFHIGKDPQPAPVVDSTASFAAGALYSTLVDLFLWDRALYTSRLLTTASLHQAFTPFKDKYGYGWFIDSLYGRPTVGHDGGIYGFTSLILRFPAEQAVIIILDNSNSPSLGELARKLAAILFGKPYQLPQPPHEAHVADSVLRPYAGRYQLHPGFIIDVTLENGALMAQATGQPKLRLYPESRTLFFIKEADAKLEFQPDSATGAVPQLILHQGGRDLPARRIN